jgi:murein DD-endopeptidase MepM/ murein hydrolase activator NlpD
MKNYFSSNSLKLNLALLAMISVFATCKKTPSTNATNEEELENKEESTKEVVKKTEEEIEIDPKEIDEVFDFHKKVGKRYQFKRMVKSYPQNYFQSPIEQEIQVAGSFCELRGNHFHGGLDIRTGGVEGWNILAAADGYIERIKVSTKGYGKALYIRHPNGYTSVYGHLSAFSGAIKNYVIDQQYQKKQVEIELYPGKNQLIVKKGQRIALSGNTGGSGGPHLHFEIRNPAGKATNPLSYGIPVKDVMKPVIKNVAIFNKKDEILHTHGGYPYIVFEKNQIPNSGKEVRLLPGEYMAAVLADDYFTDQRNRMGLNYAWATINGHLAFEYQIETMNFTEGRYINTHIDYYLKYKKGHTYFRTFVPDFNPLKYYKHQNKGIIKLRAKDTLEYKIFIQDYIGLTDSVTFYLLGDTNQSQIKIPPLLPHQQAFDVTPNYGKNFSFDSWNISIPPKVLYYPAKLLLSKKPKTSQVLTDLLQFHYGYTPLHSYVNLSYPLNDELKKWGSKLCAVSLEGTKLIYEGGHISGNSLHFKTRSFGLYGLAKDDSPPTITPIKVGKSFSFRVADNLSGVDEINCYLDDRWLLYDYEPKTNMLKGEIPAWIKPGDYTLIIKVVDARGNKSELSQKITIN